MAKLDLKFNNLSWILTIALVALTVFFVPYFFGWHASYGAMKHQLGTGNTLTVDGSKRSIIYKGDFACAEPAPDTMSTFATKLAASLDGSSQQGLPDGLINILSSPQTHVLFRRTQGIQAIRDGMFRLCEARMNTAVNEAFYEEQMTDLLSTLNFIVPLELCINASTKMGELFNELNVKSAIGDDDTTTAELVGSYMNICLNLSKDYGLTLAQNAADRRNKRRSFAQEVQLLEFQAQKELELEKMRIDAFVDQRAEANPETR